MTIDLNCDMGESFGSWTLGNDVALMQYISSANIACGFHAGDPVIMRQTIQLALKHHVAIGAHPGFPDLQGFGRRNMSLTPDEVFAMVLYQIGALQAIVRAEGGVLHHVKAHGALYNMAAKDRKLADAIAKAVQQAGPDLILYGLSGSQMLEAAAAIGLATASEVFADRTYQDDGSLTPRTQPNALIEEIGVSVKQALQFIKNQTVNSTNGRSVSVRADTLCLHGDGAHALEYAQAIFEACQREGIEIKTVGHGQ